MGGHAGRNHIIFFFWTIDKHKELNAYWLSGTTTMSGEQKGMF